MREGVTDTVNTVRQLPEVVDVLSQLSTLKSRLLKPDSEGNLSPVMMVGAALFGLTNGFLLGLGDVVRESVARFREDVACQRFVGRAARGFESLLFGPVHILHGLLDKDVRDGVTRAAWLQQETQKVLEAVGAGLRAVVDLVMHCNALQTILFPILIMLGVGVAVTLVLLLIPAAGWYVKAAGMILTFVFGVPFLIRTAHKMIGGLRGCFGASRNCSAGHQQALIESAFEICGFFLNVVLLSGAKEVFTAAKQPTWARNISTKLANSPFIRKLGITWKRSYLRLFVQFIRADGNAGRVSSILRQNKHLAAEQQAAAKVGNGNNAGKFVAEKTAQQTGKTAQIARRADNAEDIIHAAASAMDKNVKWDAKVARWRDTSTGRFTKKPDNLQWDATVSRWRDVNSGQFAKGPANGGMGDKVHFDTSAARWRNKETGRFVEGPLAKAGQTATVAKGTQIDHAALAGLFGRVHSNPFSRLTHIGGASSLGRSLPAVGTQLMYVDPHLICDNGRPLF